MFDRKWQRYPTHQVLLVSENMAIATCWWEENKLHWAVFKEPKKARTCLSEVSGDVASKGSVRSFGPFDFDRARTEVHGKCEVGAVLATLERPA